jgi:CheY-like chemotaxis protein
MEKSVIKLLRCKILTVDDDEDTRHTLALVLESEGFETVHAKNGRVALDYLQALSDELLPDLILLDYMMPVMNGVEFCQKKATNERLASIPVVMMTASGNLIKLMDRVDEEAEGYLTKPMDINSIINTIEHVIQPRQRTATIPSSSSSSSISF